MEAEFIPALAKQMAWGQHHGPMCECKRLDCTEELPIPAWKYVTGGQYVLAPGHEHPGRRVVLMEGFSIEEE